MRSGPGEQPQDVQEAEAAKRRAETQQQSKQDKVLEDKLSRFKKMRQKLGKTSPHPPSTPPPPLKKEDAAEAAAEAASTKKKQEEMSVVMAKQEAERAMRRDTHKTHTTEAQVLQKGGGNVEEQIKAENAATGMNGGDVEAQEQNKEGAGDKMTGSAKDTAVVSTPAAIVGARVSGTRKLGWEWAYGRWWVLIRSRLACR